MIIHGINSPYEVYKTGRTQQANYKPATRFDEQNDELALSSKGLDFQTALKAVKSAPDVRENKVEEAKERMAHLPFMQSSDIADKILNSFYSGE